MRHASNNSNWKRSALGKQTSKTPVLWIITSAFHKCRDDSFNIGKHVPWNFQLFSRNRTCLLKIIWQVAWKKMWLHREKIHWIQKCDRKEKNWEKKEEKNPRLWSELQKIYSTFCRIPWREILAVTNWPPITFRTKKKKDFTHNLKK